MQLIEKIYNQKENNINEDKPKLVINNDLRDENFTEMVRRDYSLECNFRYLEVKERMRLIFEKLGLTSETFVFLDDMKVYRSRFNSDNVGKLQFNYWIDEEDYMSDNTITYYVNGEMFDGNDKKSFCDGIKISSKNVSLSYLVTHSRANLVKYEIELDNGYVLTREFSNNEVFFIFEKNNNRFMIKINRKNDSSNFVLENEEVILEYLMKLKEFDIDKICSKISEVSFEGNISLCSMITLCESERIGNKWKDKNLLILRKGSVYEFAKTFGDKRISIDYLGSWEYSLDSKLIELSINNGAIVSLNINGINMDAINEYMDNLFKNDVNNAYEEVSEVKRLIREKYNVKR